MISEIEIINVKGPKDTSLPSGPFESSGQSKSGQEKIRGVPPPSTKNPPPKKKKVNPADPSAKGPVDDQVKKVEPKEHRLEVQSARTTALWQDTSSNFSAAPTWGCEAGIESNRIDELEKKLKELLDEVTKLKKEKSQSSRRSDRSWDRQDTTRLGRSSTSDTRFRGSSPRRDGPSLAALLQDLDRSSGLLGDLADQSTNNSRPPNPNRSRWPGSIRGEDVECREVQAKIAFEGMLDVLGEPVRIWAGRRSRRRTASRPIAASRGVSSRRPSRTGPA